MGIQRGFLLNLTVCIEVGLLLTLYPAFNEDPDFKSMPRNIFFQFLKGNICGLFFDSSSIVYISREILFRQFSQVGF